MKKYKVPGFLYRLTEMLKEENETIVEWIEGMVKIMSILLFL